MKRIALLTVFFYACTFAAPQRSCAVIPLAFIAAASVGAAMFSASVGAFYIQNGTLPEYVSATVDAVASGMDYLFQDGFFAVGPISLVTAASFPHAASVYLGRQAAAGAALEDLSQVVKSHPENYPDFYNLLQSHQTAGDLGLGSGSVGDIFTVNGTTYKIIGPWGGPFSNGDPNYDTYLGQSSGYFYYARGETLKRAACQYSGCEVYMATYTTTTEEPNVIPLPGGASDIYASRAP